MDYDVILRGLAATARLHRRDAHTGLVAFFNDDWPMSPPQASDRI